jgi:hypothetical protein
MQRSEQNIRRAAGDAIIGIVIGIASLLIGLAALVSALFVLASDRLRWIGFAPALTLTAAFIVAVSGCALAVTFVLDGPGRRIAFGAWTAAVGLMVAGLGSLPFVVQFATFVFVCTVARRALA